MKNTISSSKRTYKLFVNGLGMSLFIGVYFVAKLLLIKFNGSDMVYRFFDNRVVIDSYSICGTLTELQIMIFVALVILYEKRGYQVSMTLCILSCITHVMPIFFGGQLISPIGFIMIIAGGIISTIIYKYGRKILGEQERFNIMATYDSLTGLVNRRTIIQTLTELTNEMAQQKKNFAVVFIDIDEFKKINDFSGHDQGDLLLQHIASAWGKLVDERDLLGRIGGDEFALIIRRKLSDEEIKNYVETLRQALGERLYFNMRSYSFTASFGVSRYPQDACEATQLLKYADTAMYAAKADGKNRMRFFSQEIYKGVIDEMKIENALTQALERDEFYLMYQPQYECRGKKLRGFEVLIRWESEELGFVSPAKFIPLAEKTGYIVRIGEWVLETACQQFKECLDQYGLQKILSVNISPIQLLEPDFINMVKGVLERTNFNPEYLEFEVTESVFISSKEYIITILNELKTMGIHIALDDFGTNYASLSYIQMLPLDILKIDKSFIDAIVDQSQSTNLVGAIIAIAQELNYKVVAEGIEKPEQIAYLDEKGCDYIQGYLWGKPLKVQAVDRLLRNIEE